MHLHFSIRDLLWLTLVVGMALGWWLDHQRNQPDLPKNPKVLGYTPFKPLYNPYASP